MIKIIIGTKRIAHATTHTATHTAHITTHVATHVATHATHDFTWTVAAVILEECVAHD